MPLLTCDHVSLGYEGQTVVEDVNFTLNSGDYLVIVGENGTGKSTLMKGLIRLKKPMKGSIQYGEGLKPNEIGYLPQQTALQKDFPASVLEVVKSGRINQMGFRPFMNRKDTEAALHYLDIMGIKEHANRSYRDLSGGQQQRVLLARALCATGKMILLDEPVAGLDPVAMTEMYGLIEKINKELNITVVMISHDIEDAIGYASHILHLSHNQVFFGTKEDYLKTEEGIAYLRKGIAGDNA